MGNGSEGEVWRTKKIIDKSKVLKHYAIKFYKFDTHDKDKLMMRLNKLIKEFELFKSISHPYLVSYHALIFPKVVKEEYLQIKLIMD